MGAPKSIPVRSVFPARIAATTVAGYASANETADVEFLLFKNVRLPLNKSATIFRAPVFRCFTIWVFCDISKIDLETITDT
jgi:hypothetical protein